MNKKWYFEKIKAAKGNDNMLLAINSKLATDIDITGKDKQEVFKAIIKAKNQ